MTELTETPMADRIRKPEREISRLILSYRWITLLFVFLYLILLGQQPFRPGGAGLFLYVAVYTLLFTFFYVRINSRGILHTIVLVADSVFCGVVVMTTGGFGSPYYLYSLSPILASAYFLKLFGGLGSAAVVAAFFLLGTAGQGRLTLDGLTDRTFTVSFLNSLFAYFLVAVFFAYPAELLDRFKHLTLRLTRVREISNKVSRAYEELNEKLLSVHRTGTALQASLNAGDIKRSIVKGVRRLGFERVAIGLVDGKQTAVVGWILSEGEANGDFEKVESLVVHVSPQGGIGGACLLEKRPHNQLSGQPKPGPDDPLVAAFGSPVFAVVPMVYRSEPVGLIYVDNLESQKPVPESDISLLASVASQGAVAVTNAGLYGQQEKQIELLSSLYDVASVISSKLSTEEILQSVVDQTKRIIATDKAVLCLLDEASPDYGLDVNSIVVRGSRAEHPESWWRAQMQGIAEEVLTSGDPKLISHRVTPVGPRAGAAEGAWLLCVPVRVKDRSIGLLAAMNSYAQRFEENDIAVLTILGTFAAVAIENARLVAQAQALLLADERNRIAKEMHDGLAQSLFSLVLNLEICSTRAEKDPSGTRKRLKELQKVASAGLSELRRYIYDLRPKDLEELGLVGALNSHVQSLARMDSLAGEFKIEGRRRLLAPAVESCLLRVTQEATANILKHAKATRFEVGLEYGEGFTELIIEDDGAGFDVDAATLDAQNKRTFGLLSMSERIKAQGGTFAIESGHGRGTRVKVTLPG